ncbi:MAG: hypothetical protein D6742_19700 [Cyanobacteria bacterium J069]|nr:MAG: hypothetical protein D6742_19700 [Cyanobacteria bacterium J069]
MDRCRQCDGYHRFQGWWTDKKSTQKSTGLLEAAPPDAKPAHASSTLCERGLNDEIRVGKD